MIESYEECKKVVKLMGIQKTPVLKGNVEELQSETKAELSEGVNFIISTIMDSKEPVYILCMGALTNVAAALIENPSLGESWCLGDNSAVSVVLNPNNSVTEKRKAFLLDESLNIVEELDKEIKIISEIDSRYTIEDLFAKLKLFTAME